MKYNLKSKNILNLPRKNTLEAVEFLCNGKLYVDPWFTEHMDYNIEELDWNVSFSKAPTTHQLYLQGLTPVMYLVGGAILEKKSSYLELAIKFVFSWYKFSKSNTCISNDYIWDHHAAALRAESIIALAVVCSENNIDVNYEILNNILFEHANWLMKKENYLNGTNHGVYENRALLYLGIALQREDYIKVAKERTASEMNVLFTEEAVSTENSFNYQRINRDLILEIGLILKNNNDNYAEKLLQLVSKAEDFLGYAIKPDGYCAVFGDTLKADYRDCRYFDHNSVLAYAATKGLNRNHEPQRIVAYPKSGYFIGREFWNDTNNHLEYEEASWVLFKSGYSSITHKQADDNSFAFYSRGYDIFVDCGMYNYMFRNPIRNYVRKAQAHNTVVVDDKSYDYLRNDLKNRCGIAYVEHIDDEVGYAIGFNYMYHGVHMIRHFVYSGNSLFIMDEISSNVKHQYSQLFHLSKDLKILKLNNTYMEAMLGDTNYVVTLTQKNNQSANVELINGDFNVIKEDDVDCIDYGIMSEDFNEYYSIDTIKFNIIASNCIFITQINIGEKGHRQDIFEYNENNRQLTIWQNNKKIILKLRDKYELEDELPSPLYLDDFDISIDDEKITIKDQAVYRENLKYAYYITDEDSKKRIITKMYDESSNELDILFSEIGSINKFHVRVFLLNPVTNKKFSQIVAYFTKDKNNKWSFERELNIDASLIAEN